MGAQKSVCSGRTEICRRQSVTNKMAHATHLAWANRGIMKSYYKIGLSIFESSMNECLGPDSYLVDNKQKAHGRVIHITDDNPPHLILKWAILFLLFHQNLRSPGGFAILRFLHNLTAFGNHSQGNNPSLWRKTPKTLYSGKVTSIMESIRFDEVDKINK